MPDILSESPAVQQYRKSSSMQKWLDEQNTDDPAPVDPFGPDQNRQKAESEEPKADEPKEEPKEEPKAKVDSTADADVDTGVATSKLLKVLSRKSDEPEESKSAPAGLTEDDYKAARESDEGMQKLIEKQTALVETRIMEKLPQLVDPMVQRMAEVEVATRTFWRQNKDLQPIAGYVAQVADELAADNPKMPVAELLTLAAKKAREAFNLSEKALSLEKARKDDEPEPAFSDPTGGTQRTKTQSKGAPTQKDYMRMVMGL